MLIAETISRLTLPTSTMRAMSSVSASVTRNPSRNSTSLPRRRIMSPIWGPPPWTTTGSIPTERSSTMSWAKVASVPVAGTISTSSPSWSVDAASALPPYLTTTTLPENSLM